MLRTLLQRAAALGAAPLAVLLGSATRPPRTDAPAPPTSVVTTPRDEQVAVFSGGCFWGIQAVFQHVKGVTSAVSGYAGGDAATANYDRVSDGNTGHAESVRVTFDPALVQPEAVWAVVDRLRQQGSFTLDQQWSCVADDREDTGTPRLYCEIGTERVTADLSGDPLE